MQDPTGNKIRVLTFTTLYPNCIKNNQGIFVENRLRHLIASCKVDVRVIAPVPWFPASSRIFGHYADFARVPPRETRNGIEILHPRYPVVPKIGMNLAPALLYQASKTAIAQIFREDFNFDLIDAHYFYPDGVAAMLLGRYFNKPVVITARGTDINLISHYFLPGRMIRWAAKNAAGLVTVSEALRQELGTLEINSQRIRVLRNGVNLSVFRPMDRDKARRKLGLKGPTLLSIGSLIRSKGHDVLIKALPALPEVTLIIVGEGTYRGPLAQLARDLGLIDRVRFLGAVPHERLSEIYAAADILVLASIREGWPNVLLEAMACGTPALATPVGGVPEIVKSPAAGRLLDDRSPKGIAAAVRALLQDPPARAATLAYAEQFDWSSTTQGQIDLFRNILSQRPKV